MKRGYLILLSIFIIFGLSGLSNATSFTIGEDGSFVFGGIGFGDYSAKALASTFDLDPNKSTQLKFFDVSLNTLAVGGGQVKASIDLLTPSSGSLNDEGGYYGLHLPIFGGYTFGKILWGAPKKIAYGSGGLLELDLFDINGFGAGSSFIISGNIKNIRNSAPTSIPEPGAMMGLGFVLFGLLAVSRKRFNNRS